MRSLKSDEDLARLYGVETKQLQRQVRRNITRFPADFMFVLEKGEYAALRRQIGTLEKGAHVKFLPYASTEQGVAMLSSVLNSERAVQINIVIMRAFVRVRQVLASDHALAERMERAEQIRGVFDAIRRLMGSPRRAKRRIGFVP
ncbi:MAG: ORF6N domain-containing protein [Elusimicrobiota bacterium]